MPVALPYSLNASALRISTPTRASREALGLSIGGSSTPISFSRRPGLPSACSAYIGWKQPAVSAARAATAKSRAAMRNLANDIHDPHGNNDHLADGLAVQGMSYRIEGQNGSLNIGILRTPWHGYITPLLAVDLDHQRHRLFNQQIAFDLGPRGLRNQPGLAQYRPALLRQMRHHRREKLNKDQRGLADRPCQVGGWLPLARQRLAQGIGEFADIGEADVEMQLFDAGGDLVQRPVRRLAQRQRLGAEQSRPRRRRCLGAIGGFVDQPPQPLHEARGALHPLIAPDHVAIGRGVRQHEPARDVGAIGGDDVVGSTVFFFDFDIFSIAPIWMSSPVVIRTARLPLPPVSI